MQPISFERYKDLMPDDTYSYVYQLLKYLGYNCSLRTQGYTIASSIDRVLFRCLKAYQKNPEGKSLLSKVGFDNAYDVDESGTVSETFNTYYPYLTPFKDEDEYLALTPEDIIEHVIKMDDDCVSLKLIDYTTEDFLKELQAVSKSKKDAIIGKMESSYYSKINISLINYLNKVSQIYKYLEKNSDRIKYIKPTPENLAAIAYTLGLFYYDNVAYNKDLFDEKKEMEKLFEKKGLTAKRLEDELGIDLSKMNTKPSILALKNDLNIAITQRYDFKSVFELYETLVGLSISNNASYKYTLGLCGLTCADIKDCYESIKTMSSGNNGDLSVMYDGIFPEVSKLLDRFNKIYTYLINNEKIDKTYVSKPEDYLALSLLISSYMDNQRLAIFLSEHNLTFDKMLELLNLPKKEELVKLIEEQQPNPITIINFKSIVYGGYMYGESKSKLTPSNIYNNLYRKDYSKSDIINKLFFSVNSKKLPDNFVDEKDNYFDKKENDRLSEIKEKLFKDVSIDVYNYLLIVYSYYRIFLEKGLAEEDTKQLAIICAAIKYDKKLCDYLYSFGLTYDAIEKGFNIRWSYNESKLNVEILEKELGKYIFDRDPEEITVHSIFENAFEPRLTNSVRLRQLLFELGKEPEDLLNIDEKLKEYDIKKEQEKKDEELKKEFSKFSSKNAEIMNRSVLVIYDYLKNNIKDNELLTSDDDYKEFAILIVSLMPGSDYSKYFSQFNITLDYVLSLVNLTQKDLNNILNNECKNELIFEFKKYYDRYSRISMDSFATLVFEFPKLIDKISSMLNENAGEVLSTVLGKKERRVTPKEGIKLLESEEIEPINEDSITALTTYGDELEKHSKYIGDSLQTLIFNDSIDESIKSVNEILGKVVTETKIEPKKSQSIWDSWFALPQPVKVEHEFHPEKISDLQDEIEKQLVALNREMAEYESIKDYIEVFLIKYEEQIEHLRERYESMKSEKYDMSTKRGLINQLNAESRRKLAETQLSNAETTNFLMTQELLTVHRAILNHIITINALKVSKNVILPILVSEMAINKGNMSEGKALDFTNDLFRLLQSVIDKNVDLTHDNLEKLKSSSMSLASIEALNREVSNYLQDTTRKQELISGTEKSYVEQIAEETGLKLKRDPNKQHYGDIDN